jgi:Icc-related predicted phosphoesterase
MSILKRAVKRIQPIPQVFGHIPESGGMAEIGRTSFENACVLKVRVWNSWAMSLSYY